MHRLQLLHIVLHFNLYGPSQVFVSCIVPLTCVNGSSQKSYTASWISRAQNPKESVKRCFAADKIPKNPLSEYLGHIACQSIHSSLQKGVTGKKARKKMVLLAQMLPASSECEKCSSKSLSFNQWKSADYGGNSSSKCTVPRTSKRMLTRLRHA